MTRPPEKTFRDQFLREAERNGWDSSTRECWIRRREAELVLLGVPKRLIPTEIRRGARMISDRCLLFLCSALDDERVGATPGHVSLEQLRIAWDLAARTAPDIIEPELAAPEWGRRTR